jgi:Sulfatase-modifying factor enzyme 1
MKRKSESMVGIALATALLVGAASMASAQCAPDAILAGTVCMDTYEASVWRVPDPTGANVGLVKKIQEGTATAADLTAAGATHVGTASNNYDYTPCMPEGQGCANEIYAVSLLGVTPSAFGTWFQAQEACANSGKRLPTSAEWQVAANGTPDTAGADNGTTDCNTDDLAPGLTATGARSGCVSARQLGYM